MKKSTRYYNDAGRLMPGAVFRFEGKRVLQSQLAGGHYYRAVGCGKETFLPPNAQSSEKTLAWYTSRTLPAVCIS